MGGWGGRPYACGPYSEPEHGYAGCAVAGLDAAAEPWKGTPQACRGGTCWVGQHRLITEPRVLRSSLSVDLMYLHSCSWGTAHGQGTHWHSTRCGRWHSVVCGLVCNGTVWCEKSLAMLSLSDGRLDEIAGDREYAACVWGQ